jgi:hypothetical protein
MAKYGPAKVKLGWTADTYPAARNLLRIPSNTQGADRNAMKRFRSPFLQI